MQRKGLNYAERYSCVNLTAPVSVIGRPSHAHCLHDRHVMCVRQVMANGLPAGPEQQRCYPQLTADGAKVSEGTHVAGVIASREARSHAMVLGVCMDMVRVSRGVVF
jgi:hypothetical protein